MMRAPWVAIGLAALAGCGDPNTIVLQAPRAAIELRLDAPARPYVVIGQVHASEPVEMEAGGSYLLTRLRAEAARLGADAVVIGVTIAGATCDDCADSLEVNGAAVRYR